MDISPDNIILWQHAQYAWLKINMTMAATWGIMLMLLLVSVLATRKLTTKGSIGGWQNFLETVVDGVRDQIRDVMARDPSPFMPLVGGLFIFVGVSNLLTIFPFYTPPTASLSTTLALTLCVFVAVPYWGIRDRGLGGYLKTFIQPMPFMLPFNIVSHFASHMAMAVRLFGNVMSGGLIGAIFIILIPFLFPVVMNLLGLLTSMVHAYIFGILALVYIASGMRTMEEKQRKEQSHG